MSLFKRSLSLTIGSALNSIVVTDPLTIRATVVKDIKSGESDYAEVIIYNLSKGTRDAMNTEYQDIEISGGYAGQNDIIFSGSIVSASHTHVGSEWITTIQCGDGIQILDNALINKTYEKGFKLGDIIDDFAAVTGLSVSDKIDINETTILSRGQSFSSDFESALNELGKANNFDWSIQDGGLVVVGQGASRSDITRVIGARSGMVGSPEWINTGTDAAKVDTASGAKFKVVSLCIPSLKPADRIIVKSESLSGKIANYVYDVEKPDYETEFAVTKVQHDLNNREGNFITQIECTTIGGIL